MNAIAPSEGTAWFARPTISYPALSTPRNMLPLPLPQARILLSSFDKQSETHSPGYARTGTSIRVRFLRGRAVKVKR
jgi:hypothetical protein